MKVLVGYATEHGSTAEIAERIASVLGKRGVRAETLPFEKVTDLESYGGFVLGSAVHGRRWLPEAGHFVESNVDTFATRPVWLFSVGMPSALPRRFHSWAATEEKRVVGNMLRHVEPRGTRLFSGVFQPAHTSPLGRALFRAMGGRFGDYRDWPQIEAWADQIADSLTVIPLDRTPE